MCSEEQSNKERALKHQYAEVNGIRLHYVSVGTGRLIIFLHGFPEFWYQWRNQLEEFGRDYHAVAPDMRGYNLSSKPAEVNQYEVKHLVEDVLALVYHLGYEKFFLVGHDWGGVVAWAFAISHPDLVEQLIVINAPHPRVFTRELRENPDQQKASRYILRFCSPEAEKILSSNKFAMLIDAVLTERLKNGYLTEKDLSAYLEAWSKPGALSGGLNYYRAAFMGPLNNGREQVAGNFAPYLSSHIINVPTLVIWGEKDEVLLTDNLKGLEGFVSDLTIKRIPEGSHWVIHEKPVLINAFIREFIEKKG